MEKPIITDPAIKAYVEDLERQLSNFKSSTVFTQMYDGLLHQMSQISDMFRNLEINITTLSNKDDKMFDRYFKFLEKSETIVNSVAALEKRINPIPENQVEKEAGSILEEALKKSKKK